MIFTTSVSLTYKSVDRERPDIQRGYQTLQRIPSSFIPPVSPPLRNLRGLLVSGSRASDGGAI